MRHPRVGLLPLYLSLYDEAMPERREAFSPFIGQTVQGLEARGLEVARAGVCRVAAEFADAVAFFAEKDVDCIVTLHLAYSPSLESVDALEGAAAPIVMLDTTMDRAFGVGTDPDRIMYNHGIHGVMDLASVLRRRGRVFDIVAGHFADPAVIDRTAGLAKAARAARCLRNTRALRVGEAFAGMGDFAVDEDVMAEVLGISVDQIEASDLAADVEEVAPEEVEAQVALDRERFRCEAPPEAHARSVRVGLGLRRRLESGGYTAFSMNFLAFDRSDGPVNTVPFLEASKAMSRGIGYAGEGDVLTAALVGALAQAFGRTTFTEIFCPDWEGDALFLSHMGEINPEVAADTPRVIQKPFPWTPAQDPAVLTCAPAPGPAVFVNLAPGPQDTFTLIVSRVDVLGDTTVEGMRDSIRGWIRPAGGVSAFLEAYSRNGGTHHSALVLGEHLADVEAFARFAGIDCVVV